MWKHCIAFYWYVLKRWILKKILYQYLQGSNNRVKATKALVVDVLKSPLISHHLIFIYYLLDRSSNSKATTKLHLMSVITEHTHTHTHDAEPLQHSICGPNLCALQGWFNLELKNCLPFKSEFEFELNWSHPTGCTIKYKLPFKSLNIF